MWLPTAAISFLPLWVVLQIGVVALPGTNPLWEIAGTALRKDLSPAMALAPSAAVAGLLKLLTYGASFWFALQMGRDPRRAWRLLHWFAWASAVYASYGLINYLAGNRWLLWYERWAYAEDVTSTFVSRNHYATFAALGMLAATALSIKTFKENWRLGDRSLPTLNRAIDALMSKSLAYFVVALTIGMAWLQTHSRLGFAAGTIGTIVFLLVLRTSGAIRGRWALLATSVLTVVFLISVSGSGTLARLDATQDFDRAIIFARVTDGIERSPWVGYGYGSFPAAFQMFRDMTIPPGLEYTEAHSSYLELAFELGVLPAALVVVALGWIAMLNLRGAHTRQRDAILPALGASAAVIMGVHSVGDFSLQIPAIAITYAAVLAIGCAQSWPENGGKTRPRPATPIAIAALKSGSGDD
jgi:hypothetical protein